LEAIRQQLRSHPDSESIQTIDRFVNGIMDQENALLVERDLRQQARARATRMTVYAGLAVDFVLLAFVPWLIRGDLRARRKAAQALTADNTQLEAKVRERTAELLTANESLKQENFERRWSCQALDHQLRYNQLIINSIAELVFVISRALNISRVNPAALQQTSWEPRDLITQSIDRVLQFPPDPAGGSQNPLATAMRDGRQLQQCPAQLIARSGKTIPIRYSFAPLHDQDKIVGGVVTVTVSAPDSVQH
jgi:PAS domain-containing protein